MLDSQKEILSLINKTKLLIPPYQDISFTDRKITQASITHGCLDLLSELYTDQTNSSLSPSTNEIILRTVFETTARGAYSIFSWKYARNKILDEAFESLKLARRTSMDKLVSEEVRKRLKRFKAKKIENYIKKMNLRELTSILCRKTIFGKPYKDWYDFIYVPTSQVLHSNLFYLLRPQTYPNKDSNLAVTEGLILLYLNYVGRSFSVQEISDSSTKEINTRFPPS